MSSKVQQIRSSSPDAKHYGKANKYKFTIKNSNNYQRNKKCLTLLNVGLLNKPYWGQNMWASS